MDTEDEARMKPGLETSREQVLADFQAFTGIDDIETSIEFLNGTNWNLMEAVNKVLPSQELPNAEISNHELPSRLLSMPMLDDSIQFLGQQAADDPDAGIIDEEVVVPPVTLPLLPFGLHSFQSRTRIRTLKFTIIPNNNSPPIQFEIGEDQPVGMVKSMILSSELKVPVCRQVLSGWGPGQNPRDSVILQALHLPTEVVLQLSVVGDDGEESFSLLTRTYMLNITDVTHNRVHRVNFPGDKTYQSVKIDVSDLTEIPARLQSWTGWPSEMTDDTVIGLSGIGYPTHNLTVRVKELPRPSDESTRSTTPTAGTSHQGMSSSEIAELISDDDSTGDEYEDASDAVMEDMFMPEISTRPQPLMPEGVQDEAVAAIHFAEGFAQRYGPCHPMFFQGSLDDAMKEAVIQPARDRKLLAVYLHHDGSVSSNVFCTQVLCSESVVSFLTSNFIIWGWDLTINSNRLQLLSMIAKHFDNLASRTLSSFDVDKLPLLLIVTRSRATNEVLAMIPGSLNVDEMMTQLLHAVEMFSEQQRVEIAEEDERAARESVKREQDEAYQLSLEADRAKEEMKRQGEAVKQRQEEEQRVREEQARLLVEIAAQQKEARRLEVKKSLPAEPSAEQSAPGTTTCIRFRLPGNQTGMRRFLADDPLQILFDYLLVEGYPTDEFKVLSSFPRKDLTAVDSSQTLRQLGLVPQDTLTIEER